MNTLKIHLVTDECFLLKCYPVMAQLRGHLSEHEFVKSVQHQQEMGYQLLMAEDGQQVVGVAGFVLGYKLAWGKHLYIDDLVTLDSQRSVGVGHQLLDWLKLFATQNGCQSIHLDSGVQRFAAHKFYLREGFHIASHHFSCAV